VNPLVFFGIVLRASLLATSGMGNVPAIHADMLARAWATDRAFAESLAIGQITPGPSGLWVISLGYLVDGLRGALVALAAVTLPPLVVVAIDRAYRRVAHVAAVEGFVRGLSLGVVGTFVVVLVSVLHATGIDATSVVVAVACAALGLVKRVPVVVIVAAAAIAGIAAS
jgi:chromate transporter